MKTRSLIPVLLLAMLATEASAEDYKIGNLQISQPWTRATPKGAAVAGGYLKITNTGTAPDPRTCTTSSPDCTHLGVTCRPSSLK